MTKLGVTPEQLAHDMTMLLLKEKLGDKNTFGELYKLYLNEYDTHLTYIKTSLLDQAAVK
ncbi:MAG: hypothetical protein ACQEXX_19770 [Bacillota bacterium]